MPRETRGLSRRKQVFLILSVIAGVLAALLYFEQVAVIYILSTISLIVLLLVVAFSDLERVGQEDESGQTVDASASEADAQKPSAENSRKTDRENRKAA